MAFQPAVSSSPPSTRTSRTRRTRFVCISDTHNCTVKLPKGDVLIHAGDLTNQGSYSELSKAVQWLEKTDFESKIVVAGNHDLTLDPTYSPPSPFSPDCLSLLTSSPSINYLSHHPVTIHLSSPTGPRTKFTVFGSPYSPAHSTGSSSSTSWAFQYPRSSPFARQLWDDIPLSADIVVTHTPSHTHCDEDVGRRRAMGCEDLRQALWRVRPRLHVCGHVHPARGAERVRWELEGGNVRFAESGVERWVDEAVGGGKMSLVDLTGHKGGRVLDNDGEHAREIEEDDEDGDGFRKDGREERERVDERRYGEGKEWHCYGLCPAQLSPTDNPVSDADTPTTPADDAPAISPGAGTLGLGLGLSPDNTDRRRRSPARSDAAALRGRMGRRETCVVNCAILASNYPHAGGRRFNKPIVVDIELPVWESGREGGRGGGGEDGEAVTERM
ncbi:calcineurin-like phosphoesterase [Coniochaeta sp. 2T2.1]|nr:calcineurin-like phosphoesterase [Coniochaeta sp. 2T2.1]